MDYPIIEINEKDKKYPKLLKEITIPPKKLYCRGDVSLLKTECISVVGSRAITPYGKDAVKKIVSGLARHFTIVSGMALGIDAAAHEAALSVAGKTLAVLGGGVDDSSLYPINNISLARKILNHDGLIISEYKPGTKARPHMFPERNRIVSGLSKGVLIVEADVKSGSLITSKWAVEQNRDVFAVPGSIFSSRAGGPNFLIKKGAKLVASAQDIFDEYNVLPLDPASKKSPQKFSEKEKKIIILIQKNGGGTTDELVEFSGLSATEILVILTELELKGAVRQIDNGKYLSI